MTFWTSDDLVSGLVLPDKWIGTELDTREIMWESRERIDVIQPIEKVQHFKESQQCSLPWLELDSTAGIWEAFRRLQITASLFFLSSCLLDLSCHAVIMLLSCCSSIVYSQLCCTVLCVSLSLSLSLTHALSCLLSSPPWLFLPRLQLPSFSVCQFITLFRIPLRNSALS